MQKVIESKRLMLDWDYELNKDLPLDELTLRSNKYANWKCHKCGHKWNTKINNRGILGRNCPKCARKAAGEKHSKEAAKKNNFAKHFPELAKEWHPTKNGSLKPEDVSVSSEKRVWWKCSWCGNSWHMMVKTRTGEKKGGCPNCSKLSTSFPEQAIYYYIKKAFKDAINKDQTFGTEFDIFIPSIKTAIEYDGVHWHSKDKVYKRDVKKDQICEKEKIKLIRFRDPILKKTGYAYIINCLDGNDIELEKGIEKLFDYLNIKNIDINIKEDTTKIMSMYKRNLKENSLAVKFPELAKEVHPTKNGEIKAENIPWGSGKKILWLCSKCGYEWRTSPNQRTRHYNNSAYGCPVCGRKKVYQSNHIKIRNIDTGEVFDSLTDAANSCNGRKGDICDCCNGNQKSAFGYHWEYVDPSNRRRKNFKGKIRNIDTTQIFENSKEAAKWCNGDNRKINECCNGKHKTAYGYHWEYVTDEQTK